jgi:hypothetical protein
VSRPRKLDATAIPDGPRLALRVEDREAVAELLAGLLLEQIERVESRARPEEAR